MTSAGAVLLALRSRLSMESQGIHGKPGHHIAMRLPGGNNAQNPMSKERRRNNKQALTVRLDPAVILRLRQVAKDGSGIPIYASVSGIIEAGIITECERIQAILDAAFPSSANRSSETVRQHPNANHTH